jgi:cell division septal protein FtsQ
MKETPPVNSIEARRQEKRRRRRRKQILRMTAVIAVAVLLLTAIVWCTIEIWKSFKGETASFFGVKSIEVEFIDGSTRYTAEQIVQASGITVNQSLLAVKKVQASNRILQQFPYLEFVEVKNLTFSSIGIRVREVEVLAAVQTDRDWLIVGVNNHVLERVSAKQIPAGLPRITGAKPLSTELGANALDERSLNVCSTIITAAKENGVKGLTAIDVAEKTDLRFWWNDRVEVLLGNESNLKAQVAAFQKMLPTLIEKNGESVAGQFDMTSYADDKSNNDRGIFRPQESIKDSTDKQDNAGSTTANTDSSATTTPAA